MTHKHHIIPKHMGGSDDPSNLFECSVEQHAELHLSLYLTHGHLQDWLAFNALSGQITISEASLAAHRDGASRGGKTQGKKNAKSGHLKKASQATADKWKPTTEEMINRIGQVYWMKGTQTEKAAKLNITPGQYSYYVTRWGGEIAKISPPNLKRRQR